MAEDVEDGLLDWDDGPVDGRESWFGVVLCLGSAVVSVKIMGWLVVTAGSFIMQ